MIYTSFIMFSWLSVRTSNFCTSAYMYLYDVSLAIGFRLYEFDLSKTAFPYRLEGLVRMVCLHTIRSVGCLMRWDADDGASLVRWPTIKTPVGKRLLCSLQSGVGKWKGWQKVHVRVIICLIRACQRALGFLPNFWLVASTGQQV